ncbi:hypothetical protein RRG08_049246 [Elysia crispata]|uniref:Uncharacterized protein n=1 Tax=Elysia crispata TaxID=231223 RepID=A0AAE1DJB8_9GAST|nr:hypothetical protein RRG08_049246 [Elysia crispata]
MSGETAQKSEAEHENLAHADHIDTCAIPGPVLIFVRLRLKTDKIPYLKTLSRMAGLSSMKIHYFDEGGRAEVSRLVLVWAGKSFEDIRIPFQEWPDVKPTMPLGQVPVLDMGGQKYPQSLAIAAYLAREFDLYVVENGWKFIVGAFVTLADLIVYDLFRSELGKFTLPNAGKFPILQKLVETISDSEAIKAYNGRKQ